MNSSHMNRNEVANVSYSYRGTQKIVWVMSWGCHQGEVTTHLQEKAVYKLEA